MEGDEVVVKKVLWEVTVEGVIIFGKGASLYYYFGSASKLTNGAIIVWV